MRIRGTDDQPVAVVIQLIIPKVCSSGVIFSTSRTIIAIPSEEVFAITGRTIARQNLAIAIAVIIPEIVGAVGPGPTICTRLVVAGVALLVNDFVAKTTTTKLTLGTVSIHGTLRLNDADTISTDFAIGAIYVLNAETLGLVVGTNEADLTASTTIAITTIITANQAFTLRNTGFRYADTVGTNFALDAVYIIHTTICDRCLLATECGIAGIGSADISIVADEVGTGNTGTVQTGFIAVADVVVKAVGIVKAGSRLNTALTFGANHRTSNRPAIFVQLPYAVG